MNQIIVLFNGYSTQDPNSKEILLANCTCTLIKASNNLNIIIDTMTPWDKNKIIKALSQQSLTPENINFVISTHGHSDHTGNNNLFLKAQKHIVGQSVSHSNKYFNHNFEKDPYKLCDDIIVIATPGHTLSCVTVIVKNSNLGKNVAICGDLFEKKEDIFESSIWMEAGSENPKLQAANRLKLSNMVDYIVPGHGEGFIVTEEIRKILKTNVESPL